MGKKLSSVNVNMPVYARVTENEKRALAIYAMDHHINLQSLIRASVQILIKEKPDRTEKKIQSLILNRAHYIKEMNE